jgi:hypothetical protein
LRKEYPFGVQFELNGDSMKKEYKWFCSGEHAWAYIWKLDYQNRKRKKTSVRGADSKSNKQWEDYHGRTK